MVSRVYKYVLDQVDTTFEIPKGGKVLKVGKDPSSRFPAIWVLVYADRPTEKQVFRIVGTGHDIELNRPLDNYIGTAFCGEFIWHVFEVKGQNK